MSLKRSFSRDLVEKKYAPLKGGDLDGTLSKSSSVDSFARIATDPFDAQKNTTPHKRTPRSMCLVVTVIRQYVLFCALLSPGPSRASITSSVATRAWEKVMSKLC